MQPDDTNPTRRQQPADEVAPTADRTEATLESPGGREPAAADSPAPAQAPGDLTGQVLSGKYRVVRLLGKGGFGAVYEAKDEMLGASVAVKVLTPEAAEQHDALQQFLGEARLLTSLDHPNIVRWITFDRTASGLHYFVMEILKGAELSDVLDEVGQLPHARVTSILLQVLSALRAAHFLPDGRSLLHLDLKPRNVFVVKGEPEQIKVIDFGISQHVGAAARSAAGIGPETTAAKKGPDLGATIATISSAGDKSWMVSANGVSRARGGTLLFASPEQCKHLRGDPIIDELDGRSDLYSLGVMAFQMLAGRLPWSCRTQDEAFKAHLETPAPSLSKVGIKVPRGLEQFVARCLAKNRDDRYASVKEASDALYRVANPPSQWPKFVAAGAVVAGLAVWQMWPYGPKSELTLPGHEGPLFFGPARRTLPLELGNLPPDLIDQPARCVTDPMLDADMPGWTAKVERVDGKPVVTFAAPEGPTVVDRPLYLRVGDGGLARHSGALRAVWLPANACTLGFTGVRGAENKLVDPEGADFEISIQGKAEFIGGVKVSLGDQSQNATLDANQSVDTNLVYKVPLQNFGVTAAEGARAVEPKIVLVDRAGNETRGQASLRVDARPLAFAPSLGNVTKWGEGSYLVYPSSNPTLNWDPTGRDLQITRMVARGDGKNFAVSYDPASQPMQLTLEPSSTPYSGELEIQVSDAAAVFHAVPSRGSLTTTIRFRWETADVKLTVTPKSKDGVALKQGANSKAFVTNQSPVRLQLVRDTDVFVTARVTCDGVELPMVPLHQESASTPDVPLIGPGKHQLVVRGFRHLGANIAPPVDPESTTTLELLLDQAPPGLTLQSQPSAINGPEPIDPQAIAVVLEVGDDSQEPLRLEWTLFEWTLSGPGVPSKDSMPLPAGPPRREQLTWQQVGVTAQEPEDGDYKLQLEAVDTATNRSAVITSGSFVIARRPPVLTLRSPGAGEWLKEPNNTFQVVIHARDQNGVEFVECRVDNKATGEQTKWFRLKSVGADPTQGEWRDQVSLPGAWSQQVVELRWQGRDRFGNEAACGPAEATLQEFKMQLPQYISLPVTGTIATTSPMRLVKGDPNYRFGGRTVIEEEKACDDFGFPTPRELRDQREFRDQKEKVDDYYLDENEVTVAEFGAFVAAGYANQAAYWTDRDGRGDCGRPDAARHGKLRDIVADPTRARLPMTGIDWYEAAAYARWAGKRLPTKVEWEYATRGGNANRPFSCANLGIAAAGELNIGKPGSGAWATDRGVDLTPPGIGGGIRNLCSNVAEWTGPQLGSERMLTAGGHFARAAFSFLIMEPQPPGARLATLGFRCAASASSIDSLLQQQGRVRVLTTDPQSDTKVR